MKVKNSFPKWCVCNHADSVHLPCQHCQKIICYMCLVIGKRCDQFKPDQTEKSEAERDADDEKA